MTKQEFQKFISFNSEEEKLTYLQMLTTCKIYISVRHLKNLQKLFDTCEAKEVMQQEYRLEYSIFEELLAHLRYLNFKLEVSTGVIPNNYLVNHYLDILPSRLR